MKLYRTQIVKGTRRAKSDASDAYSISVFHAAHLHESEVGLTGNFVLNMVTHVHNVMYCIVPHYTRLSMNHRNTPL